MIRSFDIHYEKTIKLIDFSEFTIGHCFHVKGDGVNFIGICTDINDSYVILTPFDIPNNVYDDFFRHEKYYLDKYNPRIDSFNVDEIIIEWKYDPINMKTRIQLSY